MTIISKIFILSTFLMFLSCDDFDKFYNNSRKLNVKKPDIYVARVGNKHITTNELVLAINQLPFKHRVLVQTSETSFRRFLEGYINKELLYHEALESGIDQRPKVKMEVEAYLKKILTKHLTEELLNLSINEEDLLDYYYKNIDEFLSVKVARITLYKDKDIDEGSVKSLVSDIRGKLANSVPLKDIDIYLNGKPKLRYKIKENIIIQKNNYNQKVTSIIFGLNKDDISNPIYLNNSYNIYKIIEEPVALPYINVKNKIKHNLRNKIYAEYLSRLRDNKGVEIYITTYKEITNHD